MKCCICPNDAGPVDGVIVSEAYVDEDKPDTRLADRPLTLNGKPICRACAHTVSHIYPFGKDPAVPANVTPIPCPVVNEKNEVIPFGTYPNIDWS